MCWGGVGRVCWGRDEGEGGCTGLGGQRHSRTRPFQRQREGVLQHTAAALPTCVPSTAVFFFAVKPCFMLVQPLCKPGDSGCSCDHLIL